MMKFSEVLKNKMTDNFKNRTPMIAFLGDSVTQGCFEVYEEQGIIKTVFDSRAAYPEKVKEILSILYPQAPVAIFNAGVNGSSAVEGAERLKRNVLCCRPDLLVVCFGLNDSNEGMEGIPIYRKALKEIFEDAKDAGIETIFMTPNMMNTYTSRVTTEEICKNLSVIFAERQLNGTFDAYMDAAREICSEEEVTICDCYAFWKNMYHCGVDTTGLLANGLNHPVREMHYVFAWQLVNTILNDERSR